MLVVDVSISRERLLEEIYIRRLSGKPPGNCKYRIEKPKGYKDKIFIHKYSDGFLPLLCKCLNYLKRESKKRNDSDEFLKLLAHADMLTF